MGVEQGWKPAISGSGTSGQVGDGPRQLQGLRV